MGPQGDGARAQAKKKPRPKARQFIREETPRKGRSGRAASQPKIYGAAHNPASPFSRIFENFVISIIE
jgi:hypothetical protein